MELPEDEALDQLPAVVVAARTRPGGIDDLPGHGRAEPERVGAEGDLNRLPQRPLPAGERPFQHDGHSGVALHLRRVGPVFVGRQDAFAQRRGRAEPRTLFSERWEHALDVPEEGGVRPDQEHALGSAGPDRRVAARIGEVVADLAQLGHRFAGAGDVLEGGAVGRRRALLAALAGELGEAGEGTGAAVALPIVRAAVAALASMATFDEAGITA